MIKVEEITALLDKCEYASLSYGVVERMGDTPINKAVRIRFDTGCYMEFWEPMLKNSPEYAIVYCQFTAPTATKVNKYMLDNLDKWYKEGGLFE